jgi:hypothetical protein
MFKFYIICIKQGVASGVLGEGMFFTPPYNYQFLLICKSLNHHTIYFILFYFALNFDTIHLFDF